MSLSLYCPSDFFVRSGTILRAILAIKIEINVPTTSGRTFSSNDINMVRINEVAIRPPTPYKIMYWVGSVRSSHLPFNMHNMRSSLHVFAPTGE